MKRFYAFLLIAMVGLAACNRTSGPPTPPPSADWQKRSVASEKMHSLKRGQSYLSVYSQIYSQTEHATHNLTVTVSLRNTSSTDSVFILRSEYYDTQGQLIRTYLDHPIYIRPLETLEIVIEEEDGAGGTGGNFLFDWAAPRTTEPFFEAVMISTSGQQGLSFTTQAQRIK